MELGNTGKFIDIKKTGELWYNFDGTWNQAEDYSETWQILTNLRQAYKSRTVDEETKEQMLKASIDHLVQLGVLSRSHEEEVKEALSNFIKFFSEFYFVPNFRFTNTVHRLIRDSIEKGREYICNYFKLQDSVIQSEVAEKMKSPEFSDICKTLSSCSSTKVINKRLKIYYGPQGTGKTTQALSETDKCMVCHSAMLPSDLMEDFKFVEGKATFDPSILWRCMENGEMIILDEINLLPFESLRFLQTILDGKEEFIYKGKTVKIREGFQIIGTMNLYVNGMAYPLPEPLVDRCADIKEFSMNSDVLYNAL